MILPPLTIAEARAMVRDMPAMLQWIDDVEAECTSLFNQRDRAMKTLVRMNEAFVNAGYQGGDQHQTLNNIELVLAELERMRSQEPVAWVTLLDMGEGGSGPVFTANAEMARRWMDAGPVTPLYAAPHKT